MGLLFFLFAAQAGILERALANEAGQLVPRSQYFCREHAEHRGPNGKLNFTQDYEWIYLEGEPFRKLVARNGKPLKGAAARAEQQREHMTAAERRAAANRPNPSVIGVGNLSGKTILTEMDHAQAGEEKINGRKSWIIRAEPKPGHESVAYRLTFWIDQQDTAIAQLKYEVIGPGAESLPGTTLTTTYARQTETLWFKKSIEGEFFTGPPRPRSHWRQKHTFRDFKKFDADSTVTFEK